MLQSQVEGLVMNRMVDLCIKRISIENHENDIHVHIKNVMQTIIPPDQQDNNKYV